MEDKQNIKKVRLPIGVSDFQEVIEGQYQFADKTLFIKEVIEDSAKIAVITRPRRFGKTLNLSMLYHFLSKSNDSNKDKENKKNLFERLKISEHQEFCKKYQNKHPVIFVSFKDVKKQTFENAYSDVKKLIQYLYGQHRYLLDRNILFDNEKRVYNQLLDGSGDVSDVCSAIAELSRHLYKWFKQKPIILIDEYDTPIQASYLKGYYDQMIELMRGILGAALKDNTSLYKGVITGITRISQESLFSGVNNLTVYSVLDEKYGSYFGFLEEEVRKLLEVSKVKAVTMIEIKEWYNGYQVGQCTLYNPWSILNCLHSQGKLEPYWLNTSGNELIEDLIFNARSGVKQKFEALLQGNVIEQAISKSLVFPEINKRAESLWSLLLYAGYLKVLGIELRKYEYMAKLAVPNKEISFVYDKMVTNWFSTSISIESYENFIQSLGFGDVERFKLYISSYIKQSGSYFDFGKNTPEQVFHCFMLGLVVGLRDDYIIMSNQESGLGRFDLMFIPKEGRRDKEGNSLKGMLMEFKVADNENEVNKVAEEALLQTKEQEYFTTFKQHGIKSVLALGLAFYSKKVAIAEERISLEES